MQAYAVHRLLTENLEDFDLGDVQFFERLENDLDRACFLIFKSNGTAESAVNKVAEGRSDEFTKEERDFCLFTKSIFKGCTLEEHLQRPRQLPMGWMDEYLTLEGRHKLKTRFHEEFPDHFLKPVPLETQKNLVDQMFKAAVND